MLSKFLKHISHRKSSPHDQNDLNISSPKTVLAALAHELKTPLAVIQGHADLLRVSLADQAVLKDVDESITAIERSVQYAVEEIDTILRYFESKSQMEASESQRIEMHHFLSDIKTQALYRRPDTKAVLIIDVPPYTPEVLEVNAKVLKTVLFNLVDNAIKFSDAGTVKVSVSFGNDLLSLEVTDEGIGIPPEELDNIFKAFVRVEEKMNRRFGGTGLGLAICKRFVEAAGGHISVQSRVGIGSTFRFSLPAKPVSQLTQEAIRIPNASILVVDDNPDILELMRKQLLSLNGKLTVDVATNGKDAIDIVNEHRKKQQPFDLIFMDMQMPIVDGYSATRFLKQSGNTSPIVAITAHNQTYDRNLCLRAGCSDFITKPFSASDIEKTVYRILVPQQANVST